MLIRDYKVVVVIPAGSFPDIIILLNNLINQQNDFDDCQVWMNPWPHDLARLEKTIKNYPFTSPVYPQWPERSIAGIARFLDRCRNKSTLYIRLDNDICYLAPNAIKNLVKYKLKHPNHFLTYANCVNNDITAHFYQRMGLVPSYFGHFDCKYGNKSRHDPNWMLHVHEMFVKDCEYNIKKYIFKDLVYHSSNFGCPVNAVCWFGKDFDRYGHVFGNEEAYLISRNAVNSICGNSIMCHFKYQSQWSRLNKQQKEHARRLQKNT